LPERPTRRLVVRVAANTHTRERAEQSDRSIIHTDDGDDSGWHAFLTIVGALARPVR